MILFLCAVRQEAVCLERFLLPADRSSFAGAGGWEGVFARRPAILVQTGVGREAAERATAQRLAGCPAELVVSFGFAGALDPGLRVGDLVVYRQVMAFPLASPQPRTPAALPEGEADSRVERVLDIARRAGLRAAAGNGLTTGWLVGEPAERLALARESRAAAVDMESFWVAQVALRSRVPFLGVRVISDEAHHRVPPFDRWTGSGGWKMALGHFARRPAEALCVLQLAKNVRKAQRSLSAFFGEACVDWIG